MLCQGPEKYEKHHQNTPSAMRAVVCISLDTGIFFESNCWVKSYFCFISTQKVFSSLHNSQSGPNQLKRTKMQSCDRIHFTCWLDVSLNAFPKLLFDWSERACRKRFVWKRTETTSSRSWYACLLRFWCAPECYCCILTCPKRTAPRGRTNSSTIQPNWMRHVWKHPKTRNNQSVHETEQYLLIFFLWSTAMSNCPDRVHNIRRVTRHCSDIVDACVEAICHAYMSLIV